MAKQLSKTGITKNNTIEAWHVTQSIDALTGTDDYDITISGSLDIDNAPITNLTASGNISASGFIQMAGTVHHSGVKISGSNSDSDERDAQMIVPSHGFEIKNSDHNNVVKIAGDHVGINTPYPNTSDYALRVSGSDGGTKAIETIGDISASGDVYADDYFIQGTQFTDYSSIPNHFAIGAQATGSLILTNITASGNISASGTSSAAYFVGDGSQLTGLVSASYASTASYAVSASHEIIKELSSSHADTADTAAGLTGQPSIYVTNITASGKISASGNIYGNDFYVGGSQFTDISSVPNHFGIGLNGWGSLALQNITSSGTIKSTQLYINSGSANSVLSPQSQDAALIIMSSSGAYSTTSNLTPNNLVLSSEYYTSDAGTINDKAATSLLFVTNHGTTSQKNATAQIACVAKNSANHESYITFNTRNSSGNTGERFRIEYGQTSVIGSLDVSGNITSVGNISSSGDIYATDLELDDPTEATINMYQAGVQNIKITSRGNQTTYFNAGKVAIGTDTPSSEQLTVSGSISSSGTISMLTASIGGGIFTSASLAAGGGGGGSTFPFTGDALISGSLVVSGSFIPIGNATDDTNVIIGKNAAVNITSTSDNNVLIGNEAGGSGTLAGADGNVCIGYYAGNGIDGGDKNICIGYQAGYLMDGNTGVTAIGNQSLRNSGANYSVGIGHQAGRMNQGGASNVFIGGFAGYGISGQSDGTKNTMVGYRAGNYLRDGLYNVMLGGDATGYNINDGNGNIILGTYAGKNIVDGDYNIIIGHSASLSGDVSDQLFIGSASFATISASLTTGDIIFPGSASFTGLPTSEPTSTGSLWISGSSPNHPNSGFLMVFNP